MAHPDRPGSRTLRFGVALGLGLLAGRMAEGAGPGHRAVAPPAPALPADVVAAMQEGRFAQAEAELARLAAAAKGDDGAYYALIRGVADRLGGQADRARATLAAAIEAAPKGPWVAKLRGELAAIEQATGRFAQAEELGRAEAEALLAGDRKDRLAGVYQAFARRLLTPDDPVTPADPAAARPLLEQARALARGEALRARLLLDSARAARAAGDPGAAVVDLRAYIKEYTNEPDRLAARFELGEAQLAAGSPVDARSTWADLARELADRAGAEAAGVRAKALRGVARSHGVPTPPDDLQLGLGVAALRAFLAAAPADPSAVEAAYQVGASYLARGKQQEALDAWTSFLKGEGYRAETDEARRDLARLAPAAAFQVGQILQGQGRPDGAIAAYESYLARYPNGSQGADARRAILDARWQVAEEHAARERYAEARAAWAAFADANPLDARVPEALYRIGWTLQVERKFDEAIAAWEPLLAKFPGSEPAGHARFDTASMFEVEKADPAAAIDRFKKVGVEPWASHAHQRVAAMEGTNLDVVSPRAFRSGETPALKVNTRNLETLTFSAYKLNAEAYYRKKHTLGDVRSLDIGLVAPDAEWTVPVANYGKYKRLEADYPLPKLAVPGVYVVKVSDEKELQATTLVLGSDVDVIFKASRDQALVFAQDMKTGKGRAGARVLVSDTSGVILDAKTGPDGVLLARWEKPRDPSSELEYLVTDGADVAGSALSTPDSVAQGLGPRAYIATERPAYRPGQEVNLRGVVREVQDGQYAVPKGPGYRMEVSDARGRLLASRAVELSEFGTFRDTIAVDAGAPVGIYRIRLFRPGGSEFSAQFEVQAYQLEPIALDFDLPRTVYFRGETIKGHLAARYQYGPPAAGRPIALTLPDGRTISGKTDAEGRFPVEFATVGFGEEQALSLVARLTEDNVAVAATVSLAVRAFRIELKTARNVYLDGESFALDASTTDPQGGPTGQALTVSVLKQVVQGGQVIEREVQKTAITTDPKTGKGSVRIKVDDTDGGSYTLRVAGTDRFGNPVVADRSATISGKKDESRLRILADRQSFKVGETAKVNLHGRDRPGPALLTWEADSILAYKLVPLVEGDNPTTWAVDGRQFPNFTLTATRMVNARVEEARLDVIVERDLRVEVRPIKPAVAPGDPVEVEITAVDQLGRPVAAEVALSLVDRSLLRLYADPLPPIGTFFYNQTRTGAFTTDATNTFRDEVAGEPVPEAVVESQERDLALAADQPKVVNSILSRSYADVVTTTPATAPVMAPAPAPAPAPRSSGMGMMAGRAGAAPPDNNMPAELESKAKEGTAYFGLAMKKSASDGAKSEAESLKDPGFRGKLSYSRPRVLFANPDVDEPRRRFIETAYWNPSIVTGADGKARVTFPAPPAPSSYRFTARGATGADTLVGQATADLVVREDFFVDLKTPATLTQGDKPRFTARVHHVGVVGPVTLSLKVYAGDREQVYPKTIELKGDGVDEVLFEPFEVPDGDVVRLTLGAKAGAKADDLVAEIPIRPWGVRAIAAASGTASDDSAVDVGLPPGREYEDPEMLITVAPTLRRLLVELALGREAYPLNDRLNRCIFPPPPTTTADRASELLAATSALAYLKTTGGGQAPEATRLAGRISGLVSELVAIQAEDGSWPWVVGASAPSASTRQAQPGDAMTLARATWALGSADRQGFLPDPRVLDKPIALLEQAYAKTPAAFSETRAMILHALSTRGKAPFELANGLNRARSQLSDAGLAYLALALVELDRKALAVEVLDLLAPRAKREPGGPGEPARVWWSGGVDSWHKGPAEVTALAALAFAGGRPTTPELAGAVTWLQAHRSGVGWEPRKANGPALAALGAYYGKASAADDRFRLVVTVNNVEVYRADVAGPAEGKAVVVPRRAIKVGAPNRVRFDFDGRGTYGYSATLTGFARDLAPDQDPANRPLVISRRVYSPADPELDGKALPVGFSTVLGARTFENRATGVALGGRARVQIDARRVEPVDQPGRARDHVVVEEYLPAGTTLIAGSVRTAADAYTLADGVLTFYFSPNQGLGAIKYDVAGYLPGQYRALPSRIRGAYDPGVGHLGPAGDFRVLDPGQAPTDPYKATPDEQYARGKGLFDSGRRAEAAAPLEGVFAGYTPRDEVAKDAARMLLDIHAAGEESRKIVQFFEVLKEKDPNSILSFDTIRAVGRAYRAIDEPERALLVWRAIVEASYLEDARIAEAMRQRGRSLDASAYLLDLWREYPDTAAIEGDFFGLSQILAIQAGRAISDPATRRELADAGVARPELLGQAARIIQAFLARSPRNPLADEASLALVGVFLDLEDPEAVVALAERFARTYPRSTFLDSFQYSEALGRFQLAQYDRAIATAEAIVAATYKDANGVEQPSPNKFQAIYILGQIHDARLQPARAIEYYKQVADRFTDAAGAIKAYTRKDLKLPEVSVVRPPKPGVKPEPTRVKLDYRNVAEVDVKVYPVDLMRLYLTRRNLDAIAGVDLAGITPKHEAAVKLGDGLDFADKDRPLDFPTAEEGAYLVMARGDELYASGIVLVTPLELEVLEEADAGRVRVAVRDAATKAPLAKVQVKVIGSDNPGFISGQTDLRGVFVAEGVRGQVAAVARQGAGRYAFHRGTAYVGAPPPARKPSEANAAPGQEPAQGQSLEENLKNQNFMNRERQLDRLEKRFKPGNSGVRSSDAY